MTWVFLPFHFMAGCFAAAVRWAKLSSGRAARHPPDPSPNVRGRASGLTGPDAAADARAQELLLRTLSPDQRAQWDAHRFFLVDVPNRGTFRILPRTAFNVVQVGSGDIYCCVSESPVPLADLMLAQKLMLELDPERFFSIANRSVASDFVTPGLDFSAQTLDAAGGGDRRRSRIRCSMLSMIPHTSHLL